MRMVVNGIEVSVTKKAIKNMHLYEGDEELTGAIHCVDILFLKVDRHPGGFQAADGSEGIHGISGEPGQRLCEDQIHLNVVYDTK